MKSLLPLFLAAAAFAAETIPAESIAKKGELLFADDFSGTPDKRWVKVVPTFSVEEGALKGVQTRVKDEPSKDGKSVIKAHAAVHGLEVPTKDSVVEVRIKLDGASMVDVELDDPLKTALAGYLGKKGAPAAARAKRKPGEADPVPLIITRVVNELRGMIGFRSPARCRFARCRLPLPSLAAAGRPQPSTLAPLPTTSHASSSTTPHATPLATTHSPHTTPQPESGFGFCIVRKRGGSKNPCKIRVKRACAQICAPTLLRASQPATRGSPR